MRRYVEGRERHQVTLLPACLDDYIAEDNPVRAVDAFAEELDLEGLGFARAAPASTGRPAYHPGVLLKIYIYGYLNRVASSRRLERECQRNVELMWLTGRLAPDFKDNRRLPPGKRGGDAQGVPSVRRPLPRPEAVHASSSRHRRQQVQGGEPRRMKSSSKP
jgi:hypothetical protein